MKTQLVFKKIMLLAFLAMSLSCFSQKPSFGIGVSTSAWTGKIPNPEFTPGLFLKIKRHEFFAGVDIYTNRWMERILGGQAGYKLYFRKGDKKFNVFADLHFQYVQYGQGSALPVPYDYFPDPEYYPDVNALRTRSFVNSLGLGINVRIIKRLSIYLVTSGGYNYYETTFTPSNSNNPNQMAIGDIRPETKVIPVFLGKLGVNFAIFK